MLAACKVRTMMGARDRALLLFLLDTGVRHAELCALDLADLNMESGSVLVRQGKGRKSRVVFVGAKTRRAVTAYLKRRRDTCPALWVTDEGTRISYDGMRQVIRRKAEQAGVPEPSLHSFRRAFALTCLRNGVDLISLQRLMGHASLDMLRRYLAQVTSDLQAARQKGSPVDRLL